MMNNTSRISSLENQLKAQAAHVASMEVKMVEQVANTKEVIRKVDIQAKEA